MNILSYILLILAFVSCGVIKTNLHTDPAFKSYLSEFEKDYNIHLDGYPINFKQLNNGNIAECVDREMILVDPDMWNDEDVNMRRVTIYHELGHCVLNKSHDERMIVDSLGVTVPRSLMFPFDDQRLGLERNWQYYVNELRP